MGFKCSLVAVSPRIPREDILTRQEAGPQAAVALVEQWWPGEWAHDAQPATFDEVCNPYDDSIAVGIWGDTVVFAALDPTLVTQHPLAAGQGVWELQIHSVVDLCRYVTPPAYGSRHVELTGESSPEEHAAALQGTLLPFEEPFARGEHSEGDGDLLFHPLTLGDNATLWMFGTVGEGPWPDEVSNSIHPIEPWDIPMHRFTPAPTIQPTPEPVRRGWLRRLLGR